MGSLRSAATAAPAEDGLARIVRRLALVFALSVTIALPGGYFSLNYSKLIEHVEILGEVKAGAVNVLVSANPELWIFQLQRMEELLRRYPVPIANDRAVIRDAAGNALLTVGVLPEAPALVRSFPIYDSGRVLGQVEITHSYRAVVLGTLGAALLGLLLGGMVYATLLMLPLRALRRVTGALARETAVLRASEERFRLLFDRASDGIMIISPGGKLVAVNGAFAQMHGYSVEEMLKMSLKDLDTPGTSRLAPERLQRVLAGESLTFEVEHYHKDGHVFPLEVSSSLVSSDGESLIQAFHRDITERKQAREALNERDSRYRTVVETSSDGFWALDREGRLLDVNEAYVRRSGYTREELLQKRVVDLEARESAADVSAHIDAIMRKGADIFESLHRAKNGTTWPVEVTVRHRSDRPGQILCFLRDITERKQVEEERKRSAERLEAVMSQLTMVEERERRAIATDLHDGISQLLAVANMKLQSLASPAESGNYQQSFQDTVELIEQADRSVRSLSFQISPPLLFDQGLVPALQSLAEELHRAYRLTTIVHDDGKPIDIAPTTRSVLYRATRELLINVAKHAKVEVAHVDVGSADGQVIVSVTDSGVGFDRKLIEKHAPGSGFGLVSMRERLRLVGGQFDIDTHPGDGTVATLAVPLVVK